MATAYFDFYNYNKTSTFSSFLYPVCSECIAYLVFASLMGYYLQTIVSEYCAEWAGMGVGLERVVVV